MGHGYIPPDEATLYSAKGPGNADRKHSKLSKNRLSLDALTMQEKEELKQAIDEVLYIQYSPTY